MTTIHRGFIRTFMAAAVALVCAATPASGAPSAYPEIAAQCIIAPGVYGIVDSEGRLVGILIVYPDCRMEVFKKQEMI